MTTEELKDLIIEKQDELIIHIEGYFAYYISHDDKHKLLKKVIVYLRQQLKESELAPVENVSDYLDDCIEKAAPNLSKIEDVDKELAEIRGEQNCDNCKYNWLRCDMYPCSQCNWGKYDLKWEPKTE